MKELLDKHPKTTKLLKEYYVDEFLKSMRDTSIPEAFKDAAMEKYKVISDEQLAKLLEINPFGAVHFFDLNDIYTYVYLDRKDEEPNKVYFKFGISSKSGTISTSDFYNSRVECESKAIEKAIELLESKL